MEFNEGTLRLRIPYIILFPAFMLVLSCRVTKYVPEDEYLLNNYKLETEDVEFNKRELDDYIRQKPNKRVLFWKFYLSLYNLSNPDKANGFNNWLREIGEPPVIFDEELMEKSAQQLELFMKNKGYYHARVQDTVVYNGRMARVEYHVKPNTPYRIRDITYFFEDAHLSSLVLADTGQTGFRKGERFDLDVLQEEMLRIENVLRDSGYYGFTRDYIYFEADSSLSSFQVDVTLGIRNYPTRDRLGNPVSTTHPVYRIRDVYMVTDFDAVAEMNEDYRARDTLVFDSVHVIFTGKPNIRPGMVTQKNYIIPGSLFDASNVRRTYRNLSSLSASSMVDIRFTEVDGHLLDCNVYINPSTLQSYSLKVEGTNSGGNFGAAANIGYSHRNLFGGSELFDLSFLGAIETLKENLPSTDTSENGGSRRGGLNLMQEFGVEARLRIPKFLLPFKSDRFTREFNPQTTIRLSYNFQRRPDYTRTLANASLGYDWKSGSNLVHRVFPLEASLILTPYKSDEFQDWLEGKYLFYSYEPHMIIDSRYSLVWSNQKVLKTQSFQDIRLNVETAGNLLYAGYRTFSPLPDSGNYQILGVDFAQYVKADLDLRSYLVLYEDISLVLRAFGGVGFAYANSNAMPFEKQYFSGGANSVRGWQVKSLGPGSYDDPDESDYPNQTGDVKLEFNMEYRFKLFWKLEAAMFLDMGNIWSLSNEDDREGAGFEFNRFYREFAVGTGVGARAVFNFFVFRLDLGIPLRSPYPVEGSNWLPGNAGIRTNDLTLSFAIGYPF